MEKLLLAVYVLFKAVKFSKQKSYILLRARSFGNILE